MEIEKYLTGKGIDVSRKSSLVAENVKHVFIEPNNLYSLRNDFDYESLDFIYSKNLINETKFYKILIKEWANFCKVNGFIIIEMKSNKILKFLDLVNEINLLLKDKAEILEKTEEGDECKIIIKKKKEILKKEDSINKWSFGILSDGKRKEQVNLEIESIRALKIPYYEIIICGKYDGDKRDDVKIIDFNPEKAWITKKKNLICESAKYENIVITHDRFIFNLDWYEGMKKYGNYFEILSCNITDSEGKRVDDWITSGTELTPDFAFHGIMDPRDWDSGGYIDGGFYILKKDVWRKVKWDETLLWGQSEDLVLSRDFLNNGFVARFNTHSSVKTFSKRCQYYFVEFNPIKRGKFIDKPVFNRLKHFVKKNFLKKYYLRKYYKSIKDNNIK